MDQIIVTKNDELVMKLLHYFITEKGYNPIILHGAKDEIWLENLNEEYEIVRIVSNYIHNDEQLNTDLFRTKQIVKKIKRKTFSFKMNTLSLFVNLGDSVNMNNISYSNIDCANLKSIKDIKNYTFITENYPTITNEINSKEKGMELFMKITEDINKKNIETSNKAEDVFSKKTPYITYILIFINILFYVLSIISNSFYNSMVLNPSKILNGEYYRLLSCIFMHGGIIHLLCNMYCLYVIGPQVESFFGKIKYIVIYLLSGIIGSLMSLSITNSISLGASGAIFGLLGSILYFGYHYRVYLSQAIKSQIIPLIVLNIFLGFILNGVDNAAHIGGLIGGILVSMMAGVKYKSSTMEKVNGLILTIIFTLFLIYLGFFR